MRARLRLCEGVHGTRGALERFEADGTFEEIHTRPWIAGPCLKGGLEHSVHERFDFAIVRIIKDGNAHLWGVDSSIGQMTGMSLLAVVKGMRKFTR